MPLPRLTVFDLETTGLEPKRGHRIIEIAGVHVENGIINETQTFSALVNPERLIPPDAKQIHKITDAELAEAPTIMTVLPEFLDFANGTILVAQNAIFDMSFLDVEKEYCWGYIDLPECLCTMRLSHSLFPSAFRHNLDALCERFHIERPALRHRALTDVFLTAKILLKLVEAGHIHSFEELQRRASIRSTVKA